MEQHYIFPVIGMHCSACVLLTESQLGDIAGVNRVKANLAKNEIEVWGDFDNLSKNEIKNIFNEALEPHGYSLNETKESIKNNASDFQWAVPAAVIAIAAFLGLQKLGVGNLITASSVSFGTAFVIGLVASISTCMAVVGGLVLSLSATYAKQKKNLPHYLFHGGRLIGFFLLGGALGALGGSLQINALGTSVLSIIVALIMIILGLNLLEIFPWAKRLQITSPRIFGKQIFKLKSVNTVGPLLIGAATFFLPCGFTQSMQLYALTTNSFWTGAGLMFTFALGTLPVLGLLSFGSSAAERLRRHSGVIFKTMGLIIMFFALFNIINSLAALGLINPVFYF